MGVDKRGGVNAGGDISLQPDKFNFTASVNTNQNKGVTTGTTQRENLFTTPLTSVLPGTITKQTVVLCLQKQDWIILPVTAPRCLYQAKSSREFKPYETINITTDSLYNSGKITSSSQRVTTGTRNFERAGTGIWHANSYLKKGGEFTVDANYFTGKMESNSLYTTNYFGSGSAQKLPASKSKWRWQ